MAPAKGKVLRRTILDELRQLMSFGNCGRINDFSSLDLA
jgi:hypothetical protein